MQCFKTTVERKFTYEVLISDEIGDVFGISSAFQRLEVQLLSDLCRGGLFSFASPACDVYETKKLRVLSSFFFWQGAPQTIQNCFLT